MNYRHHFHAGNFADVMKHALLVRLIRTLQRKEKGFLYLDTHAGRGRYDLTAAATGDSLARQPEWPAGIGRVFAADTLSAAVAEWAGVAREFDRRWGNLAATPRFYPGSPWFARALLRSQDRMALCEKHPGECAALREQFGGEPRVSVHEIDGYVALRAMLPPPERRALVLIDPPFEAQNEFAQIVAALAEGLRRFSSGVFAVWYPLTERARVAEFAAAVRELGPPPALSAELSIAGDDAPMKMKGCGLLIINPPWQFDREARSVLESLAPILAQGSGAGTRVEWVVEEK